MLCSLDLFFCHILGAVVVDLLKVSYHRWIEVSLSKAVYYQKSTLISLCYWCCVNQPSFKRYKCERKRNGHQLCHVIGGIKSFCWLHQNYMWKIVRVVQNVLSLHMIIIREHNLLTAEWFPQINMCPLLLHIFVGT